MPLRGPVWPYRIRAIEAKGIENARPVLVYQPVLAAHKSQCYPRVFGC